MCNITGTQGVKVRYDVKSDMKGLQVWLGLEIYGRPVKVETYIIYMLGI